MQRLVSHNKIVRGWREGITSSCKCAAGMHAAAPASACLSLLCTCCSPLFRPGPLPLQPAAPLAPSLLSPAPTNAMSASPAHSPTPRHPPHATSACPATSPSPTVMLVPPSALPAAGAPSVLPTPPTTSARGEGGVMRDGEGEVAAASRAVPVAASPALPYLHSPASCLTPTSPSPAAAPPATRPRRPAPPTPAPPASAASLPPPPTPSPAPLAPPAATPTWWA